MAQKVIFQYILEPVYGWYMLIEVFKHLNIKLKK